MDNVSVEKRAEIMARVRSKDTKPELSVRQCLHADGFRYRLHDKNLPGSPDLVFRRYQSVCFVHGCFWHRHVDCSRATVPATRREYWEAKFLANVNRDRRTRELLLTSGWRVAIVWECALRRDTLQGTISALEAWLLGNEVEFETEPYKFLTSD